MALNCPNCGAPINAENNKCGYCGTSYFDFSSIDFTSGSPIYLRIKTTLNHNGENKDYYITQKVIPILNSMEINSESEYYSGYYSIRSRSVTTNIGFQAISDCKDGQEILFTIQSE